MRFINNFTKFGTVVLIFSLFIVFITNYICESFEEKISRFETQRNSKINLLTSTTKTKLKLNFRQAQDLTIKNSSEAIVALNTYIQGLNQGHFKDEK